LGATFADVIRRSSKQCLKTKNIICSPVCTLPSPSSHLLWHGSDRWLGPRLVASVEKLSGELAAELPISIDNTALQVVPDYRLRASFGYRF
jgi:hypothetical protein